MKCNIIDKFLYKLLFLSAVLLLIVFLDKKSIIDINDIKKEINQNINITNIVKEVNGTFGFIDLSDNVISVSSTDSRSIKLDENNYIYETKKSDVVNQSLGSVIQINKKGNYYNVEILDENNNLLIYKNLNKINVKIYQIVKTNEIIGYAKNNNESSINEGFIYCYELEINEN